MTFTRDTPPELYASAGFVPNHLYFNADGDLPPMLTGRPRYPLVLAFHHVATADYWAPAEFPWLRAFGKADLIKLTKEIDAEVERRERPAR